MAWPVKVKSFRAKQCHSAFSHSTECPAPRCPSTICRRTGKIGIKWKVVFHGEPVWPNILIICQYLAIYDKWNSSNNIQKLPKQVGSTFFKNTKSWHRLLQWRSFAKSGHTGGQNVCSRTDEKFWVIPLNWLAQICIKAFLLPSQSYSG